MKFFIIIFAVYILAYIFFYEKNYGKKDYLIIIGKLIYLYFR